MKSLPLRIVRWSAVVAIVLLLTTESHAQLTFENEPINYGQDLQHDPVAQLQKELDAGKTKLDYDEDHGYLNSVLEKLNISPESQVLVYSKTSFQLSRITPRRPRALYFNDKSYIGWVQGGDVLEVMTTDPEQGAIFYTLSQDTDGSPKFIQDRGQCLSCHASSRTQNVPGGLVRSAFVNAAGQPHYGSGTFTTDHSSQFQDRWGGWYVTGTHGAMRHMGNVISKDRDFPEKIDREAGANVTDLTERLDIARYLTPHSDIVALMVLEHQTQMQNFLTLVNFETRMAQHHDAVMNKALERSEDYVSDTTKRRIANACDKLLQYMLFAEEFPLESKVEGTSQFAREFAAAGPKDSQQRSLRDLDLQTRLFRYPCSYLIYSEQFDQLPPPAKSYIARRLQEILENGDPDYPHLTPEDRENIREILTETKPDLWNTKS
ncbi:hypothetical protein LOC68_22320 [Blastopirellula sp. JC732]|uniref:Cytochrome c domain-containing protein n=1 Tax=Blastopirellula sediminis TaxID=2894196 RepID=A0A9X1SID8_9BACT|nr:hypothetical protein [Blastopirellula sediminis]MCC9605563.1 hypothetical protein [Blastopirellula sediminis]MCC9631137.1 hypothetical protein [Blastopirellula sediminis]